MRKPACIFLIVFALFGGFSFLQVGHAATYVNSPITSNTTWSYAGSPYALMANVSVSNGATLTIEPGVTVNLVGYQLQINGALNARGSSSSKIVFAGGGRIEFTSTSVAWNNIASAGCVIDNAIIINSASIVVSGASPQISNTYFTPSIVAAVPITVNGGYPSITGNTIDFPASTNGIQVNSGSPTISFNNLRGQGQLYGIYTAGTAYIQGNNITNYYTGIWASGQSIIIQNNVMNNVHDGIRTENPVSLIQNNVAANNFCGVSGTGTIKNNTITGNRQAGIWGPLPSATIAFNNIYNNPQNIHLTETSNINAVNNWWGTTDPAAINPTIWDSKNDPVNLGSLTFDPFLSAPEPSAPSVPFAIPVPTAPPTPPPPTTQPSPTATFTPYPYQTDYPTPTVPIWTPGSTPQQTAMAPIETPNSPTTGTLNDADLINVIVILSAVIAAIAIIMMINWRFKRKQ